MRMAKLKVIVIDNESMVEYFNPMLVARIYEHATNKESRVHIGNKSYRLAMPISEAVAELDAAMNWDPPRSWYKVNLDKEGNFESLSPAVDDPAGDISHDEYKFAVESVRPPSDDDPDGDGG